ncbi:Sortase SrtE1 [Austwickia sp. TVS 96-490-7B]|uniref:class E sortase n=1 Tax=Austwickia sp. TVS 96-490-7B TaxID=2830843 RepID=UPI001C57BF58|nr:class E sortase [Austwickia sp. TVS 96-490-7B]MBW3084216.1 Sortase SrtE1 [Austwickia sp. TVS 96-490-7B]
MAGRHRTDTGSIPYAETVYDSGEFNDIGQGSELPTRRQRRKQRNARPRRSAASRFFGVFGELLVTLGVVVLLFVSWQVWWVTQEATHASQEVVNELGRQFSHAPRSTAPATPGAAKGSSLQSKTIPAGTPFGLVTVPRFGNGPQPILQGTAIAQLDQGVGHEPKSVMPGQIGNFATAGHRDTYSHPYNKIDAFQPNDAIVVEVADGWAIYRYAKHRIVDPKQVEVYAPVPDQPGKKPTEAWMTLIACEPHWTAQRRWVVHAKLELWVPRTSAAPTVETNPQVQAALRAP